MVNYAFLTKEFYEDYKGFNEIEQKKDRPYIVIIATIGGIDFAIPLRSNISHKHVVWTDKVNKCETKLNI